jgi:hypothetical protein
LKNVTGIEEAGGERERKENSIKKHSKTQMCHISQTTGIKVCIRLYYEREKKNKKFSISIKSLKSSVQNSKREK